MGLTESQETWIAPLPATGAERRRVFRRVYWSTCAVKGPLFQQVRVLPRQRSSRPGSYPSDGGGNEAVEAWENRVLKEQFKGRKFRLTDDQRRRLAAKASNSDGAC